MAAPAAMLALKAAVAAATDKRGRTAIASVIAAVLTPFILIVVVILSALSGTTSHNNAAVDLAFHGGYLSSQLPADYRMYIEKCGTASPIWTLPLKKSTPCPRTEKWMPIR